MMLPISWLWLDIANATRGPLNSAEAKILWQKSVESESLENWKGVVTELQRLVDRYPSDENFTSAHRRLGAAYLRLKDFRRANQAYRFYLSSALREKPDWPVRIQYLESLVRGGESEMATVFSAESLNQPNFGRFEEIEIRFLRAWNFANQKRWPLVEDSVKRSDATAKALMDSRQKSEWFALEGLVFVSRCAKKIRDRAKDFDSYLNKAKDVGLCFQEAMVPIRSSLTSSRDWVQSKVWENAMDEWAKYRDICARIQLGPGKAGSQEDERYKAATKGKVVHECVNKFERLESILGSWESEFSGNTKSDIKKAKLAVRKHLSSL